MTGGVVNIVIGKPLVSWQELCCSQNPTDNEIKTERDFTLFTDERVPAKILRKSEQLNLQMKFGAINQNFVNR